MPMHPKKAVVIHSGGMDSSLCLALASREFGPDHVLSMTFSYNQRHSIEIERAQFICRQWNINNIVIDLSCLNAITDNALTNATIPIQHIHGSAPNTLVVGRNGLMARLGAIHANYLGAKCIYMGVMELEAANSGYRDCSRIYMDHMQQILRMDLGDEDFEIRTPLIRMTKEETLELANTLGILEFLLKETVTCYNGILEWGCRVCPACILRNQGIEKYMSKSHQ